MNENIASTGEPTTDIVEALILRSKPLALNTLAMKPKHISIILKNLHTGKASWKTSYLIL